MRQWNARLLKPPDDRGHELEGLALLERQMHGAMSARGTLHQRIWILSIIANTLVLAFGALTVYNRWLDSTLPGGHSHTQLYYWWRAVFANNTPMDTMAILTAGMFLCLCIVLVSIPAHLAISSELSLALPKGDTARLQAMVFRRACRRYVLVLFVLPYSMLLLTRLANEYIFTSNSGVQTQLYVITNIENMMLLITGIYTVLFVTLISEKQLERGLIRPIARLSALIQGVNFIGMLLLAVVHLGAAAYFASVVLVHSRDNFGYERFMLNFSLGAAAFAVMALLPLVLILREVFVRNNNPPPDFTGTGVPAE